MPSKSTQALATRVPNDLANELRRQALYRGATLSSIIAERLRQAVEDEHRHRLEAVGEAQR